MMMTDNKPYIRVENLKKYFSTKRGILYSGKGKKTDTKILVISAMLVALAVVLNQIKLFTMPQGGSVSPFTMVPIVLIAAEHIAILALTSGALALGEKLAATPGAAASSDGSGSP